MKSTRWHSHDRSNCSIKLLISARPPPVSLSRPALGATYLRFCFLVCPGQPLASGWLARWARGPNEQITLSQIKSNAPTGFSKVNKPLDGRICLHLCAGRHATTMRKCAGRAWRRSWRRTKSLVVVCQHSGPLDRVRRSPAPAATRSARASTLAGATGAQAGHRTLSFVSEARMRPMRAGRGGRGGGGRASRGPRAGN